MLYVGGALIRDIMLGWEVQMEAVSNLPGQIYRLFAWWGGGEVVGEGLRFVMFMLTILYRGVGLTVTRSHSCRNIISIGPVRLRRQNSFLRVSVSFVVGGIGIGATQKISFVPRLITPRHACGLPVMSVGKNGRCGICRHQLTIVDTGRDGGCRCPCIIEGNDGEGGSAVRCECVLPCRT